MAIAPAPSSLTVFTIDSVSSRSYVNSNVSPRLFVSLADLDAAGYDVDWVSLVVAAFGPRTMVFPNYGRVSLDGVKLTSSHWTHLVLLLNGDARH